MSRKGPIISWADESEDGNTEIKVTPFPELKEAPPAPVKKPVAITKAPIKQDLVRPTAKKPTFQKIMCAKPNCTNPAGWNHNEKKAYPFCHEHASSKRRLCSVEGCNAEVQKHKSGKHHPRCADCQLNQTYCHMYPKCNAKTNINPKTGKGWHYCQSCFDERKKQQKEWRELQQQQKEEEEVTSKDPDTSFVRDDDNFLVTITKQKEENL